MATRRERVVLDLEDNYTAGVARAAVATGLLKKELNDLSGHSVRTSRDLDSQSKSIDKVGSSARKSGPDIDKYSGRLRTLADAALVLGPALIPLGAATIPVLTAALSGLGAAAGGIGAAVLAFKGLGDGLKALDTYQLAPTAENLQALRVEMEKLGPAGAQFVRFLDGLEPTLRDLQMTARAGIFPGVEDGIDDLLVRLPQVKRIVADLADGMGNLAAEAGKSLGGPDFDEFFRFIESDARPTLEAFAHSIGNVALGVANLLVAFAPLSEDFTGGLEKATKAFADWSKGLDENKSFQTFLAYVQDSGPQVVDLLGALAGALAGLIHAGAPLGKAVVPALTALARAFSAIADSSIGPPLYTAAAALVLFNRAASLTSRTSTSLSSSFKRLSGDAGTTSSKLGLLAGRGGVILAAAAATGQLADSIDRIDPSNIERSLSALQFGDVTDDVNKVIDSLGFLESKWNNTPDFGEIFTAGGLFGDDTRDKMQDNVDQVDQILAQMVEAGQKAAAAGIFQQISDLASAKGVDPSATAKNFDAYALALSNAAAAAADGSGKVDEFGNSVDDTTDSLDEGTRGAQRFSDALAGLNGWFDRREALRDYKSDLADLTKGLKNGFGPKDLDRLDQAGRSILQVAQGIKDPKLRTDFLANARQSLADLADHAGPKAQKAIQAVITEMDSQGLTKPHLIPLSVDDKASPTLDDLGIKLRRTGDMNPKPRVTVDPGNSLSVVEQLAHLLASLHDRTINVRTNRIGGVTSSGGGHSVADPADTPAVPPPKPSRTSVRTPRTVAGPLDKMTVLGGVTMRTGGADAVNAAKARMFGDSLLRAGNAVDAAFHNMTGAADDAATGLKGLKKQLDEAQKAFDKAKQTRDDAVSRRDALSSDIQSNLAGGSIWAASTGSPWLAGAHGADTAQGAIAALNERKDRAQRFVAALNTLKQKGVTGAALQEILSEGLEATEAMAAADLGTLSQFSTAVNEANSALAAAGLAGGNAVEGQAVKDAQKAYDRMHKDLQEIKAAVEVANDDNKSAHDHSSAAFSNAVNGGASNGHRHGKGKH